MSYADKLPDRLEREQKAVEAEIQRAFRDVTRAGGVSWSESVIVDGDGSGHTQEEARALDTEASWESLVDDADWDHEPGIGGFNFVDPIGFRYYIAPAMIRCTRELCGEFVGYAMRINDEFASEQVSLQTPDQRAVAARFVRFMIAAHHAVGNDLYGASWERAYKVYWRAFDRGSPT